MAVTTKTKPFLEGNELRPRIALASARRRLALVAIGALLSGLALDRGSTALAQAPVLKSMEDREPPSVVQARSLIRLDPGLKVELVASEPQIQSPVAMAFDEDGKLWVVEMRDYPNGPRPGQPPEGRIKVLEDRDGDGRFETSTLFADGLLFANGVFPWKNGVIVTASPAILFLRDTDGDGKADQRTPLYEGFAAENPQLRVSHPNLGLDNWIYVANGLRGGKVRRTGDEPAKAIDLSGKDFRFDPVHNRGEAISGMGQYGLTFDDWGHRFVCDNRHHLREIVLPDAALKRNPFLAVPEIVEDVSELEPGQGYSGSKIYPISRNWTTSSLHTGRFTAACSVFIYRGDLLPESYRGTALTCDPTGNLVHQEVLRPSGATFRSRPSREGVEFLASPNDWFRPVFLSHGPDGALYVVDMCRAVIEHPEFMPVELKTRPDLIWGKNHGRIWRIVPEGARTETPRPSLSRSTNENLAALLGHRNAWWRTTAQRLLLERGEAAVGALLSGVAGQSGNPLARLHAGWLLSSLGRLDETLLLQLLQASEPGLRQNAVRMAEPKIDKSGPIRNAVLALAEDPDPQVRFQIALSMGAILDKPALEALAKIGLNGADDRWTRWAVASALPEHASDVVRLLISKASELQASSRSSAGRYALVRELSECVGARNQDAESLRLLGALETARGADQDRWHRAGLAGLAAGLSRHGKPLAQLLKDVEPVTKADAQTRRELRETVDRWFRKAGELASKPESVSGSRLEAVQLLAHAPWAIASPVLSKIAEAEPDQELRVAAVRALANQGRAEVGELLLSLWPSATPQLRREVVAAMLRDPQRLDSLFDAIAGGRVRPGDLDTVATNQLLNHPRGPIRDRAVKLLGRRVPEERLKVVERYKGILKATGDPQKGRVVFQNNCATCHRVAGTGVDVGPDIGDTRVKTPEQLLNDILNPNGAIDGNYISYIVSTRNGAVLEGLIASETATSLTLKRAENQTETILRTDLEEIRSTGLSLMPEGLEKKIGMTEMADLITFLKNWRYLESQ